MFMSSNQKERGGISLRTVHFLLIIGAVFVSILMFLTSYRLSTEFESMTEASERQIELRKAARELMDASDYLTENVQRFTLNGDRTFMDAYFREAFEANHREEAIQTMSREGGNAVALKSLQTAMDHSVRLMGLEYYAMRLVIEAQGIKEYPDVLKKVTLRTGDAALSPQDKMRRATEMVLDAEYYEQKNKIRAGIQKSIDAVEKLTHNTETNAMDTFQLDMNFGRGVILLQILVIFFVVWLTSHLGINPILRAVDRIKEDCPIPEVGANEFRYLAQAYNKMYSVYKSSIEHLNFKASHDELTGAYNRAGYELLLSGVDLKSTYMILFDVDHFKSVNDTWGHETGDKVLRKLVSVLKRNFRSDDYVCRIGGDEFVVFMGHASEMQQHLIKAKIENINEELGNPEDGLPPFSVSVGIAHGLQVKDEAGLFEKCDLALYESKNRGRHTYTFYSE
jgi:diguanylate cyclase (GGDEF)-like protein